MAHAQIGTYRQGSGFVGGRKAGVLENALKAVFLPAMIIGGILFFLGTGLTGIPLVGFLAGLGGVAVSLIHVGPLLVGAVAGALVEEGASR